MIWRQFNATCKPGSCLWCGRKLGRPRVYKPSGDVPVEDGPVSFRKGQAGDYADNAFCGLRCGYMFGVRLAELGDRLKAKE